MKGTDFKFVFRRLNLSLTISLIVVLISSDHLAVAQNTINKETSSSMAHETNPQLFRWNGVTFGIYPSEGEEILYKDENTLMLAKNDTLCSVAVTYNFSPRQLSADILTKLNNTLSLNISAFSVEMANEVHQIPTWLGDLIQLQSLAIWGADLSSFTMFRGYHLIHLDLRKAQYTDSDLLIDVICSLKELEVMICDDSISEDVTNALKQKMPTVKFIKKGK